MLTRHTTMVVGPTGGGKTIVIDTLSRAQTKLGLTTRLFVLNPKAVTVAELYGVLDPVTRDWTDGLLSNIFRELNRPSDKRERKYILFDGDVDAVWVENMNSVMDDNRLLTLPNGERIRLQKHVALLFEVSLYSCKLCISFTFLIIVGMAFRLVIYNMRPQQRFHVVEWFIWILKILGLLRFTKDGVIPDGLDQMA